jgi:DNA mismatch repair ATPase MutS
MHTNFSFMSFRVIQGVSRQSYGHHCALVAGVPEEIVERATQAVEYFATGNAFEPLSMCLFHLIFH